MDKVIIIILFLVLSSCSKTLQLPSHTRILEDFESSKCTTLDYNGCYSQLVNDNRTGFEFADQDLPRLKAIEYVDTLDKKIANRFWLKYDGKHKGDHNSPYNLVVFLRFSDEYRQWLKDYSTTREGKWIASYIRSYNMSGGLAPSIMQQFDDTLLEQDFESKEVRLICLIHHLTNAYNMTYVSKTS